MASWPSLRLESSSSVLEKPVLTYREDTAPEKKRTCRQGRIGCSEIEPLSLAPVVLLTLDPLIE